MSVRRPILPARARYRAPGLWVALLAWLLSAALAPGVMPVAGGEGPTMVLCTAGGPTPLPAAPQEGDDPHAATGACPFAAAQAPAAPVPTAAPLPALHPATARSLPPAPVRRADAGAWPAHRARAPPLSPTI